MKRRAKLALITPLILLSLNSSLAYWNSANSGEANNAANIGIGLFPYKSIIVLVDGSGPYDLKKGDIVQHGDTTYVSLVDQVITKVPSSNSLEGIIYWNSPSKMLNIDSDTHILSNYYDELSRPIESHGKYYIPLKKNPSQIFVPEGDYFPGWFCLEEDYNANNDYLVAGTLVRYNDAYYYNTKRSFNNLPTNSEYFAEVEEYQADKNYEGGVIVTFNNSFYYLRKPTSSSPQDDPMSWQLYSFEGYYQGKIVRSSTVSSNYLQGELVLYGYDDIDRRVIKEII